MNDTLFIARIEEIIGNPKLTVTQNRINDVPDNELLLKAEKQLGISLQNTPYAFFNGIHFSWKVQGTTDGAEGCIKLLTLEEIIKGFEGIVYFSEDSNLKDFYILDFYSDENCIGIFKGSKALYLYSFDREPIGLGISLDNYFDLLSETRGLMHWPLLITAIINNEPNNISLRFNEVMKPLFEQVSLKNVTEVYSKNKIL